MWSKYISKKNYKIQIPITKTKKFHPVVALLHVQHTKYESVRKCEFQVNLVQHYNSLKGYKLESRNSTISEEMINIIDKFMCGHMHITLI